MIGDECIALEKIVYGVIIPVDSRWELIEDNQDRDPRFKAINGYDRWYIPINKLTFLKRGEPKNTKRRVIRD